MICYLSVIQDSAPPQASIAPTSMQTDNHLPPGQASPVTPAMDTDTGSLPTGIHDNEDRNMPFACSPDAGLEFGACEVTQVHNFITQSGVSSLR